MAPALLSTRLRRCVTVPNHSNYSYDHSEDHMHIETFLPEEKESHNQNKDCLHMTKYLERDSCKSADAYKLAEVRPHGNSARKNYKYLLRPSYKWNCELSSH